ncbi:hypothetical protein PC129_g17780 [Phytophthora cactorum]|uniref:Uncharacterized protein n=1 Tax=Phytophthora cactorum TaxID=29920 RepID=A0A8T1HG18_9STRA|nr:hypothetical protein PC117_g24516 [Phytophthora cactorum]KAG2985126.1 hypothetical protein PC119_g20211 [Phytophthora cactorum]KAG3127741.1 hypothetical protein C6341_g24854 [Phytophthora cactorum]KAG3156217.1 hypothetical protein PC128_g21915 [Phytophthora cactorum]KAG3211243.1 hypothetical protein PC129_g17780 [Phytophthora cactorum]
MDVAPVVPVTPICRERMPTPLAERHHGTDRLQPSIRFDPPIDHETAASEAAGDNATADDTPGDAGQDKAAFR